MKGFDSAWLANRQMKYSDIVPSQDVQKLQVSVKPSTDLSKLNKTESAYWEILKRGGYQWIGTQCLTFKLADDTRYTPDFIVVTEDGRLEAHEVKGFWRDDAKVKIKVAARQYAYVQFKVVMKTKNGWEITEVKP